MIGTFRPWAAATPAADAVCVGATVRAMASTPAAANWVICAVMSWSVALICAGMMVSPRSSATASLPARPFSPG